MSEDYMVDVRVVVVALVTCPACGTTLESTKYIDESSITGCNVDVVEHSMAVARRGIEDEMRRLEWCRSRCGQPCRLTMDPAAEEPES